MTTTENPATSKPSKRKKSDAPALVETRPALTVLFEGMLPIEALEPNGSDARTMMDPIADQRLRDSLQITGGNVVPIICTFAGDTLEPGGANVDRVRPIIIRGGHRRYRMLKELGIPQARVVVYKHEDRADFLGEIENLHRQELSLVDKCMTIGRLVAAGHAKQDIMLALGISGEKEWSQISRVSMMHPDLQELLRTKKITLEVALALVAFPMEEQMTALKAAGGAKNAHEWTVRQLLQEEGMPVAYALFARDAYRGPIAEDLFSDREKGDGRRFLDRKQFFELQRMAIEKIMQEARDDGQLVYLHEHDGATTVVESHSDKRVKAATIVDFNLKTGYAQTTKDAQLRQWGRGGEIEIFDVTTGEWVRGKEGEKRVKAEAKAKAKAKDAPPEEKNPFTKTAADHLKRQATLAIAGALAKVPHAALCVVLVRLAMRRLNHSYKAGGLLDAPSTIEPGQPWPFTTMYAVDKKSAEGKRFLPMIEALDERLEPIEKAKQLHDVLKMKPVAIIEKLLPAAVALTLECDHYGNTLDDELVQLADYLGINIGETLIYDDAFRGGITKAGCIQWMHLLGMIGKGSDHEKMNRTQLLSAIEKKFGSLEAAGKKALPPISGVAPS